MDAGQMGAQARCITAATRPLQALPEPMTLFRRSTRPWRPCESYRSAAEDIPSRGIKAGQFSCRSGFRWR